MADLTKFKQVETKESIGYEAFQFHTALWNDFIPIFQQGEKNKNMVFFNHWDEAEILKHTKKDRMPLNFPLLYKLMMNLLGYEKSYPALIQTEPSGQEDELTSFMYNLYLKHIQEQTEPVAYKHQRSDIFQNGNVSKYGCCEICTRVDEFGDTEVYLKSIPYNQVMFDRNFTDYEMSECSRVQYFEDVYMDDLIEDYPEQESTILNLAEEVYSTMSFKHQWVRNLYDKSEMNKGKKILRKIYDFKKELKTYYYVYTEEKTYQFDSSVDAKYFIQTIQEEGAYLKTVTKTAWFKTVLVHNEVLEDKHCLEVGDECPLTFYFPVFVNGEFTNIVEVTQDLQKYHDRLYSQIDYNMGVAGKVLYEINRTKLDASQTDADVDKAISEGGKIYTKSDAQVVRQNLTKAIDPQYFMILEGLMKLAEDNFGGKNFQGVQQYSNQSGIAIEKLQAAAVLIATTYISNLERYSEILGRKLVKYISKFYTQKKSFKVIGDFTNQQILKMLQENQMYQKSIASNQVGYITTNDENNPMTHLQVPFKYSIKIVNKDYNSFEKENELQKLMLLQQQGLKIPPDMLMYFMGLDPLVTHRLMEQMEEDKKAAQAQMIEEQKTQRLQAMNPMLATLQKDKEAAGKQVAEEGGEQASGEEGEVTNIPPDVQSGGGDLNETLDAIVNYI